MKYGPQMEPSDTQAGQNIARLLLQCHTLEKGLASSAGLTVEEFHCLSQIYVRSPRCVKELCEMTGFRPTRTSRLLNSLEEKGYLERSIGAKDHRTEKITLTQAGLETARALLRSCALSAGDLMEVAGGNARHAGVERS